MNRAKNLVLVAVLFLFVGGAAVKHANNDEHVYWLITADVKEGQLENLKALGKEMVHATLTNEPLTLAYDWSVSADGKTAYFYEHYKNSEGVMVHTKTFGEKYAERIFTMMDIKSFEIFGNPNAEVTEAYTALGANFHKTIGGFQR